MNVSGGLKLSLNKGSLDKANQNQKLDIEYIYHQFTAGENIAAGQVVMISTAADETVLIATNAVLARLCGVAMETKLSGQQIKICVYGIATVTAGENITRADVLSVGATAGRAYKRANIPSSAGSAHTHAETLGMGVPSTTGTEHGIPFGTATEYCADTSGGASTILFYAVLAMDTISYAKDDHSHTISGAITNESAHTHYTGTSQILGKALETFTTGNTGKVLVCLA